MMATATNEISCCHGRYQISNIDAIDSARSLASSQTLRCVTNALVDEEAVLGVEQVAFELHLEHLEAVRLLDLQIVLVALEEAVRGHNDVLRVSTSDG